VKRPYRYFRSELNGFYLRALVAAVNIAADDIVNELIYHTLFQWKLEGEVTATEIAIREEDIYNIATIAGLFPLRLLGQTNIGSLSFSASHIVNGKERSERGLFDMQYEYMRYVRTVKDDYLSDIAEEANKDLRMSLVPNGTQPVGYIPFGVSVYDEEGNFIPERVLQEPPTDGTPYAPFYGEKFLTLENVFSRVTFLDLATFKKLFECLQRVENNGPTIASFLDITQMLCERYVYDVEILSRENYYVVNYRLNRSLNVSNRVGRYNAWQHVCGQRFKLFVLNELED